MAQTKERRFGVRRLLAGLTAVVMAGSFVRCGSNGGPGPDPTPTPSTSGKPNIVLVILDDLDASAEAQMPRLKSLLADQGVTFTNTMMATPLCAPNRATLFTGLYAHNHGITGNAGAQGLKPMEQNLLPVWLKQAGYRTSLAGKYINQYPDSASGETAKPPGWDDWHGVLEDRTATSYNYFINDNGVISHPTEYQTDLLANRAVDFLNATKAAGSQPFFLLVGPGAPHSPSDPAERHAGRYAGAEAPRTPAFNEEDVSDKPKWLRNNASYLTPSEIQELDYLYSKRLESLLAVEDMVDKIIQTLSANGQLANTWIFFTTDNGVFTGQHRLNKGKMAVYDAASRVPLLVRGPGAPAGRVLPHLISTVDLPATFLAMAGGSPDNLDGKSLVPLLGSSPTATDQWRKEVLVEGFDLKNPINIPAYASTRTAQYTVVDIPGWTEKELYDLVADPYQTNNMVRTDSAKAQPIVDSLMPRLNTLRTCRAATCR